MLLVDIIAGVIIGALSGMGIGGGGLLVIYLRLLRDYAQIDAQAANLLFFVFAAAASLFIHIQKREIDIITVTIFATTGIVGSLMGSRVTSMVSEDLTGKIFGFMLVSSGIITLVKNLPLKRRKNAS